MSEPRQTPAGWYPDTQRPGYMRWWDGSAWTDQRKPVTPAEVPVTPAAVPVTSAITSSDTKSLMPHPVVAGGLLVAGALLGALMFWGSGQVLDKEPKEDTLVLERANGEEVRIPLPATTTVKDLEIVPFTEPVDVEPALAGAGLTICDVDESGSDISGSTSGQSLSVVFNRPCEEIDYEAADFVGHDGLIVSNKYSDAGVRARAAQSGFGDSLFGFYIGSSIVSVTESSKPEVLQAFEKAMAALGAPLAYDRRVK